MNRSGTTNDIEDLWPLAPLQATMLLASLRAPAGGAFVQQEVMGLQEPVDARAFQAAWQALVQRTPALRASFHWQNLEQPVQVVHREATLALEQLDWRQFDASAFQARLAQYLEDGRRAGFTLDRAPLMRVALVHGHAGETRFVWQFHHILFDGWSAQLLVTEVVEHYRALLRHATYQPPPRRSLCHYFDWLATRDAEAARAHWRQVLRGHDEPMQIGLPRPAGGEDRSRADAEGDATLDPETSERLRAFARQHGLTLNTVLQGAWALLLGHYADRDDVVFGAVVSGRPPEVPGIEQMIGLFINAVPVRVHIDAHAALVPWLKDLQSAQVRGSAFHYLGSVELQRCSELPPGTSLFETLLVFENFPHAAAAETPASGLDLGRADVPLSLLVVPGERLRLKLRFDRRRFRAEDMTPLAEHLLNLLHAILNAPFAKLADLSPLSADERRRLIDELNTGDANAAEETDPLVLLQRLAYERGAGAAFIAGERVLDYQTLHRASSRLAQRLRRAGVARGVTVAVSAPRSFEQVVAFYAVLKAHGVYVPLDPAYPERRLAQMLEDAQPAVLLAGGSALKAGAATVIDIGAVLDLAGDEPRGDDEPVCWQADDPAYIVFTSGSTGRPKGVLVHWGQVSNRLAWMWQAYPFGAHELACQRTAINFVDSLWELMGATLQGVSTLIVPEHTASDAKALIGLLAARGVTRLWFVPSLLKMLLEARPDLGQQLPQLRFWVSSGEPLPADLFRRFRQAHPQATLYNLYGTSEVWDATWFDPEREPPVEATVPIGRPIRGMRAYVLDRRQRLLPFEVAGELCIGGTGVARGYVGPAKLNDERFVADPFAGTPGARMYRTGDLARVRRDGLIVYLGRRDLQIKLRGVRVEPADIEAALRCASEVRDAILVLCKDRLVAYVAAPAPGFDARRLLAGLRERLPDALVPAAIVRLDALPLTPNGKCDKLALPPPDEPWAAGDITPAQPLEAEVQACFAQVLELRTVALEADFFRDLGGHSLLALRVSSRLSRLLGIEVPAGTLFDHPSVRQLAAWLARRRAEAAEAGEGELLELVESLPAAEREALLASLEPDAPGAAP